MKEIYILIILVLEIIGLIFCHKYLAKKNYDLKEKEIYIFLIPFLIILGNTILLNFDINLLDLLKLDPDDDIFLLLIAFYPTFLVAYYYLIRSCKTKQLNGFKLISKYFSLGFIASIAFTLIMSSLSKSALSVVAATGFGIITFLFAIFHIVYIFILDTLIYFYNKLCK